MGEFKLDLEDVLAVYRSALGSGALLVNGFIRKVVATKDGTAAIDKTGRFYYCPQWFKEYVTTPGKLRDIVMHEIMHPVLGDMSRDMGILPNLAGDIVINSMLFSLGLSPCELMEEFYPMRDDPYCLLRPNAKPPDHLLGIYASVYPGFFKRYYGERCTNPLEIMRALQVHYPVESALHDLVLLGGHLGSLPTETEDGEKINVDDIYVPGEVVGDVGEICCDIYENMKIGGGNGEHVSDMTVQILRSKRRVRAELLRGFEARNTANKLKQYIKGIEISRSIVPTQMTRSEATKVVMGVPPLFYRRKLEREQESKKTGVAFYLDVSGSVYEFLPKILGIFAAMRDDVDAIFTFSNVVVKVEIDDFIAGKLKTTGGTDFNCVVDSAVKEKYDKVIVFTDGAADLDAKHQLQALRYIKKMALVYFGNYVRANWIEQHYKKYFMLDKILETT